jgi:hypothetical protein
MIGSNLLRDLHLMASLEQNASSEKTVAATQAALSELRGHECPQLFVPFVVLLGLSYLPSSPSSTHWRARSYADESSGARSANRQS